MKSQLIEKINEISLMLVMATPGDPTGVTMLVALCRDAAEIAKNEPAFAPIVKAVSALCDRPAGPPSVDEIEKFVSLALRFVEGDSSVEFSAVSPAGAGLTEEEQKEIAELNVEFLAEFVETHVPLLEDIEGTLIAASRLAPEEQDPEELVTVVKRYLHNLKGDSGSIGLTGMSNACHVTEDYLQHHPILSVIPQLIEFTGWARATARELAEGLVPSVSAARFVKNLQAGGKPLGGSPVETQAVASTGVDVVAAPSTEVSVTAMSPVESTAAEATRPPPYCVSGEKDLLVEFASEAEEHLANLEATVLDSDGQQSREAVDTIFRAVHSLKGGSAYFTIDEMTQTSHILENYFSEVRDGKRELDKVLLGLLLRYIDLQKDLLKRARVATQGDGMMQFSQESIDFLKALEAYDKGLPVGVKEASSSSSQARREDTAEPVQQANMETTSTRSEQAPPPRQSEADPDAGGGKVAIKSFVKVDTTRLDTLVDSIGEMVIYSSMLIRHCRELLGSDAAVMDTTHRVEKFSRELQDIGMSMRLVPIKGLFQKMSRLVWDTSKKLGKEIDFVMEGEDTELDRNLIDKLADPLMHMVRNSLDHGIEPPDEREKSGKPRTGRVRLSASHSGGNIQIRIEDDGRGLNPQKLIAKAIEKGILSSSQTLSDEEAFQLIFAAGFSTAAAVTDLSGRGVGMDVVRRNVESLRGRIHISSEVGGGSIFTIELPLTLAIIDGVQIRVGEEEFILPSLSIVEIVRPSSEMLTTTLNVGQTLRFRGKYLPIIGLSELYDVSPVEIEEECELTMVVVDNNGEQVAVVVDEVLGEVSTVIKSLGPLFEENKGIAGCAIMPSGNVALILDIRSLVQLSRTELLPWTPRVKGMDQVLTH